MAKILVTGGAGFIGSHIADFLIKEGNEIIIIDNLSSGRKENINIKARFYNEDLGNSEKLKEIFEQEKPEVVYHLAAQLDVRKSVENPVFDAKENILNTINLLELCRNFNTKHFIFSSTGGAMFNDETKLPASEDEKEEPISPYGIAKLAVERYLEFYNKIYGLKYTILRYSNVYGPRQNPFGEAGVVAIFLNNMLKGETPVIYGGLQTRDFIFVEDVARANLLALNDRKNRIYNVSSGKEIDIIELFNKINSFFENRFFPVYKERKKGEVMKSCLKNEKIRKELGWIPAISLEDGLKKTYKWRKINR